MYLSTCSVQVERENQKEAEAHFWRIRLIFFASRREKDESLTAAAVIFDSVAARSKPHEGRGKRCC